MLLYVLHAYTYIHQGTVRAASFKAIGDVIANRGLNIATYGKFGPVDYNKDHVDGMYVCSIL